MNDFDTRMRQAWENVNSNREKNYLPGFIAWLTGGFVAVAGHTMSPEAPIWLHVLILFATVAMVGAFLKRRPKLTGYIALVLIIGAVVAVIGSRDG